MTISLLTNLGWFWAMLLFEDVHSVCVCVCVCGGGEEGEERG